MGPVTGKGEVDSEVAERSGGWDLVNWVPPVVGEDGGWRWVSGVRGLVVGFGGVEADLMSVKEVADAFSNVDHFVVCVGCNGCVVHKEKCWGGVLVVSVG